MKANKLILAAAFCAVLSADAAVVRKLPAETVVEGESISFDPMGNAYFGVGDKVGRAFSDGARLKSAGPA